MTPGLPSERRSGPDDGIVKGAWNPISTKNDLTVRVSGQKLAALLQDGIESVQRAVDNVTPTLVNPQSVFEAADGDWLYYRQTTTLPSSPAALRRQTPPALFCVRVRPTGARAHVWIPGEPADPQDPLAPLSRAPDGITRRLK